MFLAIDECVEGEKKVFGGVLLPLDFVPSLEADFVRLRIQRKLWGELKWNRVDQYWSRYTDFVQLFFNAKKATYQGIIFRNPSKRYNAAYILLRTITWKLQNFGFSGELYVLFDESGSFGNEELKKIRAFAQNDLKFKIKLSFCNQGTSHVIGALQLADLLSGAVHAEINKLSLQKEKKSFYEYIYNENKQPLSFRNSRLPKLYEQKMQIFDPDR
jgi:hypothetical protein